MEQVGSFKRWKGFCWHGPLPSITVNLHSSLWRLVRRRWEAHNACQCVKCFKRRQTPWNQPTTVLDHGANAGGWNARRNFVSAQSLGQELGTGLGSHICDLNDVAPRLRSWWFGRIFERKKGVVLEMDIDPTVPTCVLHLPREYHLMCQISWVVADIIYACRSAWEELENSQVN